MPASMRVRVDLSNVLSASESPHPITWMHIDVSVITTVRLLAKRIKRRYGLSGKLDLFLEDGLLPPDEEIQVLRENDVIRAVSAHRSNTSNETSTVRAPTQERKRRRTSVPLVEEHENLSINGATCAPLDKATVSTAEETDEAPATNQTGQQHTVLLQVHTEATTSACDPQVARRKRVRKHKKRKRTVSPELVATSRVTSYQASTPIQTNAGNKHKFFDDGNEDSDRGEPISEQVYSKVPSEQTYSAPLLPRQPKQRSFQGADPVQVKNSKAGKEDSQGRDIAFTSAIVEPEPPICVPFRNAEDEKAAVHHQQPYMDEYTPTSGDAQAQRSYDTFPPLRVPMVGNNIAFKVLEMDENYSPRESSFREGKVLSFNPKSGQVSIRLTEPVPDPSMFVPITNDGEGPPLVYEVSHIWSHLLHPVLLSHASA
ncbi:uncharacterized protein LOC135391978 [Ornithodoros turicata]|uniref:uncharacterized protein LOC135391978 n=1 Tax=Ornithodoros turicata TaxID=34597 RepID=UPI00313A2489